MTRLDALPNEVTTAAIHALSARPDPDCLHMPQEERCVAVRSKGSDESDVVRSVPHSAPD